MCSLARSLEHACHEETCNLIKVATPRTCTRESTRRRTRWLKKVLQQSVNVNQTASLASTDRVALTLAFLVPLFAAWQSVLGTVLDSHTMEK